MKIYIERQKKTITKNFSGKIVDLLKQLKINSNEVLVVKNGSLINEEENVEDSDELRILSVISGG
jgi:sulfur carrier protein ThiS